MKYKVSKKEGIELNGSHYDYGHEFVFTQTPEHVLQLVEDGSLKKVAKK